MTRIKELIARLAPSGVPFVRVGDAFRVVPTARGIQRSEYSKGSRFPIVDQGQLPVAGYTDDASVVVPAGDLVVFGDHTRIVKWVDFDFAPGADGTKVLEATDQIVPRYGFHTLSNLEVPSRGYNRHWSIVRELRVPVPPIAIQEEIVRILDQFTDLEAQLAAELEARRHQYDFYRASLLVTREGGTIPIVSLGEALSLRAGKFIAASEIFSDRDDSHPVPCFGGNGLRGYVAKSNHVGDYVVIGRQGAWSGNVKRVRGEFYATEHAVVVTPVQPFDTSWLFHQLTEMNLGQYVSQGAQPGLAVSKLNSVPLSIPTFPEQVRIGRILDMFDALVNDLSIGLPAELRARRQQYEYYREKLLTFPEAAA